MRRASVAFSALALALCCARHAQAEPARSVGLAFEGCSEADVEEIRRLLAIDFDVATTGASYAVVVRCQAELWQLSVVSSTLTRSLDFASTAVTARARLTAIVVGELVAEAAAERDLHPARPPSKPVEVSPPAPRQPAAPMPERFRVSLLGGGRTLLGGVPRLLGATLRFEDLRIPWGVDVQGEQGAVSTSGGVVSMRSLSGALSLSLQQAFGGAEVRAGVGLRAGAVWMKGEPNDATLVHSETLQRGWAGPLLATALALRLPAHFAFRLVVEGGYTVWSVYGLVDGKREAALSGVWLGAQVGVGWSF